MLPPNLERIREKLAENIHELWAVTRIEQGWTYASVSTHTHTHTHAHTHTHTHAHAHTHTHTLQNKKQHIDPKHRGTPTPKHAFAQAITSGYGC